MVHAIPTLPRIPAEEPRRPTRAAPVALRALRGVFRWLGPWAPEALAGWATRILPRRGAIGLDMSISADLKPIPIRSPSGAPGTT